MNKYWIEIKWLLIGNKRVWIWNIKCCNGRVKAQSNTLYPKKSLCLNDANSIAREIGLEVRVEDN